MVREHFLVKGKVQGVGFRKFVFAHAIRLNLSGYCQNLPSGEVEIEVEGDFGKIRELLKELQFGPPRGRVDEVVTFPSLQLRHENIFVIRDELESK
jgi:acylphosphatase